MHLALTKMYQTQMLKVTYLNQVETTGLGP